MHKNFPSKSAPFLLIPDEKIILQSNSHPLSFSLPLGVIFLLLLGFITLNGFDLASILEDLSDSLTALAVIVVVIAQYLNRKYSRLYLTSRRVVKEHGMIRKRFTSIFLDQIENVSCSNGIMGEILGFGNLEIESANGRVFIKGIVSVKKYKRRIAREINKLKQPRQRLPDQGRENSQRR